MYLVLVKGTTQLCRTSKLSIDAKGEDKYYMNKPEKFGEVWDLILGQPTV